MSFAPMHDKKQEEIERASLWSRLKYINLIFILILSAVSVSSATFDDANYSFYDVYSLSNNNSYSLGAYQIPIAVAYNGSVSNGWDSRWVLLNGSDKIQLDFCQPGWLFNSTNKSGYAFVSVPSIWTGANNTTLRNYYNSSSPTNGSNCPSVFTNETNELPTSDNFTGTATAQNMSYGVLISVSGGGSQNTVHVSNATPYYRLIAIINATGNYTAGSRPQIGSGQQSGSTYSSLILNSGASFLQNRNGVGAVNSVLNTTTPPQEFPFGFELNINPARTDLRILYSNRTFGQWMNLSAAVPSSSINILGIGIDAGQQIGVFSYYVATPFNGSSPIYYLNSTQVSTIVISNLNVSNISVIPSNPYKSTPSISCNITAICGQSFTTCNTSISWLKNNVNQTALFAANISIPNNTATLVSNISNSYFSKGEQWACLATTSNDSIYSINNQSANVTILNSIPTIKYDLMFSNGSTGHWFYANATANDSDGGSDISNVSIYVSSGSCVQKSNYSSGLDFYVLFNCSNTAQTIPSVNITFNDTSAQSVHTATSSNQYPDHAASLSAPILNNSSPNITANITCLPGNFTDLDLDTENTSGRTWKWFKNGIEFVGEVNSTILLNDTNWSVGSNVSCWENATNSTWPSSNASAYSLNATIVNISIINISSIIITNSWPSNASNLSNTTVQNLNWTWTLGNTSQTGFVFALYYNSSAKYGEQIIYGITGMNYTIYEPIGSIVFWTVRAYDPLNTSNLSGFSDTTYYFVNQPVIPSPYITPNIPNLDQIASSIYDSQKWWILPFFAIGVAWITSPTPSIAASFAGVLMLVVSFIIGGPIVGASPMHAGLGAALFIIGYMLHLAQR